MREKNKFKIISVIVLISLTLSIIPIWNISIRAETNSKPSFDIQISANPNPSIIGEDVTVSGLIQPRDFEVQTLEQELVIVLDVSKNKSNGDFNKIVNPLKIFIDKLNKNKLKNTSLKIGIITYDDNSEISEINNKKLVDINTEKDNEGDIKKYLGNINTNKNSANKNIGDALRQAVYLLDSSNENNTNANKTILLISEGNTDSRRVESDGQFCLDTSKEIIENTNIITDNSEKNLEYAKAIGSIVKNKGYNVFTMGFDIDTKNDEEAKKEENILKEIHSSMTGYDLNDINYEEKGLFLETRNPSDNKKTIEGIFTEISYSLINNYYINNVNLNLDFDNDIILKSGGNSVKLENIKYEIYTSTKNSVIYKADPIPFSFVIKAKKVGEQNVFKNLSINYLWKNKYEIQVLDSNLNITVENNNLPNISATLISEENPEVNTNDEITLQYKITPKEVLLNDLNFMKKDIGEVIFLLDINKNITDNQRGSIVNNGIANILINKSEFNNIKFSVIGFSNNPCLGVVKFSDNSYSSKVVNNIESLDGYSPFFQNGVAQAMDNYRSILQNIYSNNNLENNREIDNSLILAEEVFDKYGDDKIGKAIVLIMTDSVKYTESTINRIKSKGYRIILLDVSSKNTQLDVFLKDISDSSKGDDYLYDYLKATLWDQSNYNGANQDMTKVAERLKSGVIDKDKFITPKFTFDLNNNFEYVETSKDNISLVSNKDNKLELTLNNPIEYKYFGQMVDDRYKFIANEQTISFKVKVKDSKLSNLTFGSNNTEYLSNYMSYNNFSKEEVKVALKTPVVKLIQKVSNVSHGLYNGIVNNKVDIKENTIVNGANNPLILAGGSTLVMGSTFNTSSDNINLTLNIDDKFKEVKSDDIIVYRVIINNGVETLEEIKKIDDSIMDDSGYKVSSINGEANKFNVLLNKFNNNNEDTKILIVYKGTIKNEIADQILTNNISFGSGINKEFIIKTNQEMNSETEKLPRLPDLF